MFSVRGFRQALLSTLDRGGNNASVRLWLASYAANNGQTFQEPRVSVCKFSISWATSTPPQGATWLIRQKHYFWPGSSLSWQCWMSSSQAKQKLGLVITSFISSLSSFLIQRKTHISQCDHSVTLPSWSESQLVLMDSWTERVHVVLRKEAWRWSQSMRIWFRWLKENLSPGVEAWCTSTHKVSTCILSSLHILTLAFGKSWEIITWKRKASFLLGVRTFPHGQQMLFRCHQRLDKIT